MRKYDVILSLGDTCAPASTLRAQSKNRASYPFDWLLTKHGPLPYFKSILSEIHPFNSSVVLERRIDEETDKASETYWYEDKENGIGYRHEFYKHIPYAEMRELCIQKYKRRMKRLSQHLEKAKNVCFIMYSYTHDSEIEHYKHEIEKKYDLTIDLMYTDNQTLQECVSDITLTYNRSFIINISKTIYRALAKVVPFRALRKKLRRKGKIHRL